MRRYYRSRVCVCVLLILLIFIFSENECSKPLMHLIYVNATRVNMLRSIRFRKIFCTLWRFCNTYSGTLEIREQCFQRDSYYVDINVVVMHQSIPAAPSPASPPGYCGAFARLVSPGGLGIYKFCTVRGPGICQPRGRQRAFDTLAISYQNITTQKVLLEKKQTGSPVKDRNKLKRIVKACSRFYAYISSLLVKPELHSENRNYRCESTCFGY